MNVQAQDMIWVVGVLVIALACLWYVRAGLQDRDMVLAWAGGLAAAGFVLAAFLYWMLVWGS